MEAPTPPSHSPAPRAAWWVQYVKCLCPYTQYRSTCNQCMGTTGPRCSVVLKSLQTGHLTVGHRVPKFLHTVCSRYQVFGENFPPQHSAENSIAVKNFLTKNHKHGAQDRVLVRYLSTGSSIQYAPFQLVGNPSTQRRGQSTQYTLLAQDWSAHPRGYCTLYSAERYLSASDAHVQPSINRSYSMLHHAGRYVSASGVCVWPSINRNYSMLHHAGRCLSLSASAPCVQPSVSGQYRNSIQCNAVQQPHNPVHWSLARSLCTKSAPATEGVTLENIFSDSNRRRVASHLDDVQPVRTLEMMGVKKKVKVAAVLVPFCMVDQEPSILFTLRSSSLRKHKGEVSFPGGNQDDTDVDLTHTALRETFEETGLHPRHFEVWGTLTPTPSSKSRGSVAYPVLAKYTRPLDLSTLTLNAEEVEEVFTVSVAELCDSSKVGSTQFRTEPGYTLPVFLAGPHRIWGLTAIILHQTLTLIAPGLYSYRIRHVS